MKIRGLVVDSPNKISVKEVPDTITGDYDCFSEMVACGICNGTDRHLIEGRFPYFSGFPFVLGHESIGRVLDVGRKVERFKDGDMVLRTHLCYPQDAEKKIRVAWGGFAEYGVVTDAKTQSEEMPGTAPLAFFHTMQQIVPKAIDPVEATLLITAKETYSVIKSFGGLHNKKILILGTGPVALFFMIWAKLHDAGSVIIAGRTDEKLKTAKIFGADYAINIKDRGLDSAVREITHTGADVAIDAVGATDMLELLGNSIAEHGRIYIYGVAPVTGDEFNNYKKGIEAKTSKLHVSFVSPDEPSCHVEVLNFVENGKLNLSSFVTGVYSFDEIDEAFAQLNNPKSIKTVVKFR